MLFFLTLTQQCNLACTYCGSDENVDIEDISLLALHPKTLKYSVKDLKKLEKLAALPMPSTGKGDPEVRRYAPKSCLLYISCGCCAPSTCMWMQFQILGLSA